MKRIENNITKKSSKIKMQYFYANMHNKDIQNHNEKIKIMS